jgi:hypothetical protein
MKLSTTSQSAYGDNSEGRWVKFSSCVCCPAKGGSTTRSFALLGAGYTDSAVAQSSPSLRRLALGMVATLKTEDRGWLLLPPTRANNLGSIGR